MQETEPFPSIHVRCYHFNGRICSLYEIGRSMSRPLLDRLVSTLQSQGCPVESLQFYEYGDSDSLRHLFIKLEGQEAPVPYFQLDRDLWLVIISELTKSNL